MVVVIRRSPLSVTSSKACNPVLHPSTRSLDGESVGHVTSLSRARIRLWLRMFTERIMAPFRMM